MSRQLGALPQAFQLNRLSEVRGHHRETGKAAFRTFMLQYDGYAIVRKQAGTVRHDGSIGALQNVTATHRAAVFVARCQPEMKCRVVVTN